MMIQLKVNSSKVKINTMLNRAGLLFISFYINNVCCRMLQQQHYFGEMIAYLRSGRGHGGGWSSGRTCFGDMTCVPRYVVVCD